MKYVLFSSLVSLDVRQFENKSATTNFLLLFGALSLLQLVSLLLSCIIGEIIALANKFGSENIRH